MRMSTQPKSRSPRPAYSNRRRRRSGPPTWGDQRRNWCSDKPFLLWDSLSQTRGQILEARVGLVEIEIDEPRRSVALLADDDLGAALERVAVLVRRSVVHLLAIDEHHQIGILLDGARLAKVGKLRSLVLARALLWRA